MKYSICSFKFFKHFFVSVKLRVTLPFKALCWDMNLPQLTAGPLQNSLKGKFCFLNRISVHSIWVLSVEELRGAKHVSRKTWGRSNDIFLISHVCKMCQKCKCHSYCAWFSDQKKSSEGWFERGRHKQHTLWPAWVFPDFQMNFWCQHVLFFFSFSKLFEF